MEDRKLYHLVNGEFVHDGMPSVHIPTYEEVSAHIAILQNVGFFDDPIAESVPAWSGIGTGKRSDAVQASLFDMIHAEILDEHNAEKAKVRNRRKADRKAKRKSGAYVKRNGGDFRKDEHYAGDGRMWHDYVGWEHTKSQIGGKIRERSLRKDYDAEIRQREDALAEYDDYVYWADEHDRRYRTIRRYLLDFPLRGNLNHLRNMTEELTREMRYEECRIKDMCENARIIWEGECY